MGFASRLSRVYNSMDKGNACVWRIVTFGVVPEMKGEAWLRVMDERTAALTQVTLPAGLPDHAVFPRSSAFNMKQCLVA